MTLLGSMKVYGRPLSDVLLELLSFIDITADATLLVSKDFLISDLSMHQPRVCPWQVSVAPPHWVAYLFGSFDITFGLPPDIKAAIDNAVASDTTHLLGDFIHGIPLVQEFYNGIKISFSGGLLLNIDSGSGNVKIASVDSSGNISPIELPHFWCGPEFP